MGTMHGKIPFHNKHGDTKDFLFDCKSTLILGQILITGIESVFFKKLYGARRFKPIGIQFISEWTDFITIVVKLLLCDQPYKLK